jgi:hypothetical protein
MILFSEVKLILVETLKQLKIEVEENQIEIKDLGYPHKTEILPKGKMAVYAFFYGNECLKIGKAGPKSNARYNSQHYNPESSKSNLAKSLVNDSEFNDKVNLDNVSQWIKENTQRINVLIDQKVGILVLNFCEVFLQLYFKPRYEGFKSQNK